eukprot:TRINITY_DN941_c0_g1_i1.p1 TRINITY_DN941_c0_g1~~TRINITY_DN941_c0_g1_i1.p1  ORF type:complete len:605 (-),score=222.48 TRINITY_DN941_c0_g1_i1:124-1938(-)
MSFREIRDFIEMMKSLGYPRLISMENFRTPNFELVADILYWLVHRHDPSAEIPDDIGSEEKRAFFLKSIGQLMATKARIKLNLHSLHQADGFAVKELIKIASLLYDAMQLQSQTADDDTSKASSSSSSSSSATMDLSLNVKQDEIKEAKNLATQIVDSGVLLHALLGKEDTLKEAREKALRFIDQISMDLGSNDPHEQIEKNIREQINLLSENITELEKMCDDLTKEQKTLKAKIDRKQADLVRADKRLNSMKQVRPAFRDEYDKLEKELRVCYNSYVEKYRNLHYLETELSKYHKQELERKMENDRILKQMQKRLREEELAMMHGDREMDDGLNLNNNTHLNVSDSKEAASSSTIPSSSSSASSSSSSASYAAARRASDLYHARRQRANNNNNNRISDDLGEEPEDDEEQEEEEEEENEDESLGLSGGGGGGMRATTTTTTTANSTLMNHHSSLLSLSSTLSSSSSTTVPSSLSSAAAMASRDREREQQREDDMLLGTGEGEEADDDDNNNDDEMLGGTDSLSTRASRGGGGSDNSSRSRSKNANLDANEDETTTPTNARPGPSSGASMVRRRGTDKSSELKGGDMEGFMDPKDDDTNEDDAF